MDVMTTAEPDTSTLAASLIIGRPHKPDAPKYNFTGTVQVKQRSGADDKRKCADIPFVNAVNLTVIVQAETPPGMAPETYSGVTDKDGVFSIKVPWDSKRRYNVFALWQPKPDKTFSKPTGYSFAVDQTTFATPEIARSTVGASFVLGPKPTEDGVLQTMHVLTLQFDGCADEAPTTTCKTCDDGTVK
jgi:hypothetical protein